jgi:predicted nucleotidyltransferase component of viral defense system
LDLIKELFTDDQFNNFLLVGGTALSLQIGHRISIDIDLFCDKPFDSTSTSSHLLMKYNAESIKTLKNGVFCFIQDIKVDVMSHQYPWIMKPVLQEGIRMASLEDISAMKLHAIVQSGSRLKDFVDVYHMLERISFRDMVNAYEKKYPDTNRTVVQNAILYHSDIKPATIDLIGQPLEFSIIASRLKESIQDQTKIFKQDNAAQEKSKLLRKKRRGRGL